jgi:hypothetical protein
MTKLGALPLSGFMVGFFPIKLANCSAAPARVVAFVDWLPRAVKRPASARHRRT